MIQHALKWGGIFCLTMLIWMLLENLSGLHSTYLQYHMYLTNLFAIPAIYVYAKAAKEFRIKVKGGKVKYIEALQAGLATTLVVVLLSAPMQFIISTFISPEYFPNVIKLSVEMEMMTREEAEAQFNLANYMKQSVIGAAMMGVITSLIVAFFSSKKSVAN